MDDALHDLLMRRAALTRHMGTLKAQAGPAAVAANPVRPAREAAILRRLAARHGDEPSFAVVVRIWRELIADNLRRQCAFALTVAEDGSGRLRDLARAEYGALTPVISSASALDVIGAVETSPGMLGILPAPAGAPPDWRNWPELLARPGAPRILCALPMLAGDAAPGAFAVGRAPAEASGDDTSFVLVMGRTPPRAEELAEAGLDGGIDAVWPAMSASGLYCGFAAVRGFIGRRQIGPLDTLRRERGGSAILIGAAPSPVRLPVG